MIYLTVSLMMKMTSKSSVIWGYQVENEVNKIKQKTPSKLLSVKGRLHLFIIFLQLLTAPFIVSKLLISMS